MTDGEEENRIVPLRLQKFLARAGVASRRGSENLMTAGRVTINGRVVTELGSKVDPRVDEVAVDGMIVQVGDGSVTLMLHKPVGVLTTMSDPQGRSTVAELVPISRYPGLFPVGRLDRDTTGLLLFSTDGDMGHALLRPRGHVTKSYVALVEGRPSRGQMEALRHGVELDDGPTLPAEVEILSGAAAERASRSLTVPPTVAPGSLKEYAAVQRARARGRTIVRIGLHEGRKRQVRRMLQTVGHPVLALHRDEFGPVGLGDLPSGSWRMLSSEEEAALQRAVAGWTR